LGKSFLKAKLKKIETFFPNFNLTFKRKKNNRVSLSFFIFHFHTHAKIGSLSLADILFVSFFWFLSFTRTLPIFL